MGLVVFVKTCSKYLERNSLTRGDVCRKRCAKRIVKMCKRSGDQTRDALRQLVALLLDEWECLEVMDAVGEWEGVDFLAGPPSMTPPVRTVVLPPS